MYFDASLDPISFWLYAERYLFTGTRSYSPFARINEMDAVWHPNSDVISFEIPSFWVEASNHAKFIYKSSQIPSLKKFYSPEPGRFLFPLHPATIPLLPLKVQSRIAELAPGPKLNVSPTSSTRTLYVYGTNESNRCPQHFLKLHFPGRISRFIRSITDTDVIHQLWVSEQIQKARLPHLPDLGGGYAIGHQKSSVGFLIRSTWPENRLDDSFFTLPGFSLFGIDKNSPSDPPLLTQLPRHFGETAVDFIVKRIIVPTVDLWVRTVSTLGIILELHGQNVLFCFNRSGSFSSIRFRDSDLFVDNHTRRQIGVAGRSSPVGVFDNDSNPTSEQILSLCYDGFLVHHFLSKVAALAKDWLDIPVKIFRDAAIFAFRAAGGDELAISDVVYYFDNQLHADEQFVLIEQPSFDLWR